jgi:hypothetical protein
MFILSRDEHQLTPKENRVILSLENENGPWNRESYVSYNYESPQSLAGGPVGPAAETCMPVHWKKKTSRSSALNRPACLT